MRDHLHSNDSANGNIDLEVLAALLFKGRPAEAAFPVAVKEVAGREILTSIETKTLKERLLEFKASREAAENRAPKFETPADGYPDAKETAAISSEAASVNAQAALRAKLSGLQKAQENAAVTKTLPDGRIRYYTQEVPARTEGVARGASFATEYNPTTGSTRQWMESYDHSGNIIRVHPKSINGQPVSAQHYPPTGAELESWK